MQETVTQSPDREMDERQQEIQRLQKVKDLTQKYPDLKKHTNRWRQVRYYTALVNGLVTKCEIASNCGCCADSPLEVWPYLEADGMCVYADPIPFTVGESFLSGSGEVAKNGWAEEMRSAGITEVVIQMVEAFFLEHPPKEFDEERELGFA